MRKASLHSQAAFRSVRTLAVWFFASMSCALVTLIASHFLSKLQIPLSSSEYFRQQSSRSLPQSLSSFKQFFNGSQTKRAW
jgi:hypothetical protein